MVFVDNHSALWRTVVRKHSERIFLKIRISDKEFISIELIH